MTHIWMCFVEIWAGLPAILTEVCHGFPLSRQIDAGIISHDRFFPDSFEFICHGNIQDCSLATDNTVNYTPPSPRKEQAFLMKRQ